MTLRFAIVGCGEIAPTHVEALRSIRDRACLAAVCDADEARALAFADRHDAQAMGLDEVLQDASIDAVAVCTPSGLHATVGVRALQVGKHVIVEKPMDISVAACDRLVAAQRESGTTLAVVSQRRFDDASQHLKSAIDNGAFGEIVYADCRVPWHRTQSYYDSGDWRGTWDLDGGGCLMNQGLHTIDLLRWICGPVKSVYAQARTAAHARIEVEDVLCATLSFENGAIGTVSTATCSYPAFPARLGVHGTAGGGVIEGDALIALAVIAGENRPSEPPMPHALRVASGGTHAAAARILAAPEPVGFDPWTEGHRRQFLDFVRAVESGGEPLVSGREGRKTVELIEAIYRSARTGRPEDVVAAV